MYTVNKMKSHLQENLHVLSTERKDRLDVTRDGVVRRKRSGGLGVEHCDYLHKIRILHDNKRPVRCCRPERGIHAEKFALICAASSKGCNRSLVRLLYRVAEVLVLREIASAVLIAAPANCLACPIESQLHDMSMKDAKTHFLQVNA